MPDNCNDLTPSGSRSEHPPFTFARHRRPRPPIDAPKRRARMPRPVRPARRHLRVALVAAVAALIAAGTTLAITKSDPGADYYARLQKQSQQVFGFGRPLDGELQGTFDGPGDEAVELAAGLTASVVSDRVGEDADMIALWPDDANPTHAIICNEIDGAPAGSPATIQSVELSS